MLDGQSITLTGAIDMRSQQPKRRKGKVHKAQTYSARRRADRACREKRRARTERRQREQRQFKFRVKVVRTYQKTARAGLQQAGH